MEKVENLWALPAPPCSVANCCCCCWSASRCCSQPCFLLLPSSLCSLTSSSHRPHSHSSYCIAMGHTVPSICSTRALRYLTFRAWPLPSPSTVSTSCGCTSCLDLLRARRPWFGLWCCTCSTSGSACVRREWLSESRKSWFGIVEVCGTKCLLLVLVTDGCFFD